MIFAGQRFNLRSIPPPPITLKGWALTLVLDQLPSGHFISNRHIWNRFWNLRDSEMQVGRKILNETLHANTAEHHTTHLVEYVQRNPLLGYRYHSTANGLINHWKQKRFKHSFSVIRVPSHQWLVVKHEVISCDWWANKYDNRAGGRGAGVTTIND